MRRSIADLLGVSRVYGSRTRILLTVYFFIGLAIVFLLAILFTGRLARKMEQRSAVLTRVFSQFIGETLFDAADPGAFAVIRSTLAEIDFPIIVTDARNAPFLWHGVDVPLSEAAEPGELGADSLSAEQRSRRQRLDAYVRAFDAQHAPYPIEAQGVVQAYLHYGPSLLSRQLRSMPWVLVMVMAIFTTVGLLGFRSMKRSEQRSIWVGMARETAHQLGTPLTSLMGWVQLLRSQEEHQDGESAADAELRRQRTYEEMEHDLGRLAKVSARFSKIGSVQDLELLDVAQVVRGSVEYIRKRTPHLGTQVHIEADLPRLPPVRANRELLEWVFENLLKNALDALPHGGHIAVRGQLALGERVVEIRIADDGKGIPATMRKRIWEPGFTTKQRGWGLGLTLVRRIVEEYHGGRIWVEDTASRRGICFAVRLPVVAGVMEGA